jgi:excisionase family DNA binding protein
MHKPLLTIPEFCREYSVSRSLAYRLLGDGDLRAVKVGRLTRVTRAAADAWLRQLESFKPKQAT